MRRLLFLSFLIFSAVPAFSTTYYVRKTGSGTTCSNAAPCLTVAIGIGKLAAGDTLLIGNGVYAERISNTIPAGSSCAAPTTIQAENEPAVGAKGTITANAVLRPTSGSHVIINTHANVKVRGLEVDASSADGNPFSSYNGSVTFNCYIIEYNNIHGGNDIFPGGSSGILGDLANSFIRNNEVHNNGNSGVSSEHGIYTPGPSNTIENNYIHDNEGYCLQIYPSGDSNIIRGNRCENQTRRGIIIYGSSNQLYNNIEDGDAWGVEIGGSNNLIYQNTFYDNGHGSAGTGRECVVFTSGSGNQAKNNICYMNEVNSINQSGGTATVATNTTADPSFMAATTGDFTLTSSSVAINAGTTLGSPYNLDIAGKTRSAPPDNGAYEFDSALVPPACSFNQCETFDNYTVGAAVNGLNSGTGWSGPWTALVSSGMTIQTAPSGGQGGNALRSIAGSGEVRVARSFTGSAAFTMRVLFFMAAGTPPNALQAFDIGSSAAGLACYIGFQPGGTVTLYNAMTALDETVGTFSQGVWSTLDVEVDDANHNDQCRARVGLGTWSDWKTANVAFTTLDMIHIVDFATSTHTAYYDGIGGSPASSPTRAKSIFRSSVIQ